MGQTKVAGINCQFCQDSDLEELLFLGYFPPVNALVKFNEWDSDQNFFPLQLLYCRGCFLVQIGKTLNPSVVFPRNYPYLSGMTKSLVANFSEQSEKASRFLDLKLNDLVIDIASNDGSLLSNYRSKSRILGVEPTDTADVAIAKGIPTIKNYFDATTVNEILKSDGQATLITICNAFAHIPIPSELILNIKKLLKKNGVFISENHYLGDLVKTLQFDTIYHEHLRYYSVKFLVNAFSKFGLDIFRVENIDSHGGSIRVWACHEGEYEIESSVRNFLLSEEHGISRVEVLRDFALRVATWRQEFRELIAEIRQQNQQIIGIGAPSRASTLLGFAGLSEFDLSAVAELPGSLKIDRFMPGTRIPIVSEDEALSLNPQVLLLLSWHLGPGLLSTLVQKGFRGRFLVPLPEPRLVEATEINHNHDR